MFRREEKEFTSKRSIKTDKFETGIDTGHKFPIFSLKNAEKGPKKYSFNISNAGGWVTCLFFAKSSYFFYRLFNIR